MRGTKRLLSAGIAAVLAGLALVGVQGSARALGSDTVMCYTAFRADIGWQTWPGANMTCNGGVAGWAASSQILEAVDIKEYGITTICGRPYVHGAGWAGWQCVDQGSELVLGHPYQPQGIDALELWSSNGQVCGEVALDDIGWDGERCGSDVVLGDEGLALRIREFSLRIP